MPRHSLPRLVAAYCRPGYPAVRPGQMRVERRRGAAYDFARNRDGNSVSDANIHALPVGHEFDGYRILRVLGAGGFGITYLAEEVAIGRKVAIKEFLPQGYAARATDSFSIRPVSAQAREQFAWGLDRFQKEAATLVNFEHPNIVAVHRYFVANGTAYLVMQYVEGKPLDALLAGGKTLTEPEIEEVIGPILDGLEQVHAANFLHRDIKPANIYIRKDGRPVLLDFGAARQAFGSETRSITAIVSEGYAPFEQYEARGDQGPWTDLYAVGAVIYRCATGQRPPAATERISAKLRGAPDPMLSAREAARGEYSARLLDAAERALAPTRDTRPQTVAELRALLKGDAPSRSAPAAEPASRAASAASATVVTGAAKPKRRLALAAGIAAVLAAGAAGAYMTLGPGAEAPPRAADAPASPPLTAKDMADPPAKPSPEDQRRADAERSAREERARAEAEKQRAEEAKRQEEARRQGEARRAQQQRLEQAEAQARFAAQRLEQARIAAEKRRWPEARRLADDVESLLKPALAAAPQSLAVAAVQRDLVAFRQELARRIGDHVEDLLREVRLLIQAGKLDAAERKLDDAEELAPASPDAKAARAELAAARKRAEEAVKRADEARKAEDERKKRAEAERARLEEERKRNDSERREAERKRAAPDRPPSARTDPAPAGSSPFAGRIGTLSRISAERRAVMRVQLQFGAGGTLAVSCTAEAADGGQAACFGQRNGGGRWSSNGSSLCLSSPIINLPANTCYQVSGGGNQYTLTGPGFLAGGMFLR